MDIAQYLYKLETQDNKFGDTCEIKCTICGKWFKSSLKYASAEQFLNSVVYKKARCPICGNTIIVSKNNKRYGFKRQIDGRCFFIKGIENFD
jgi:ribosomal protein S27AE